MKLQKPTIGFAVLSITALVLSCIALAMILFKHSKSKPDMATIAACLLNTAQC